MAGASHLNRIKNPGFKRNRGRLAGWTVVGGVVDSADSTSLSEGCDEFVMEHGSDEGGVGVEQHLAVRPGKWYRTEFVLQCAVQRGSGGASLRIEPMNAALTTKVGAARSSQRLGARKGSLASQNLARSDRRVVEGEGISAWRSDILRSTPFPIALRTVWECPPNVRRIRLWCGLENAAGWAKLMEARFFEILEPDEESHVLAIPPPNHTLGRPKISANIVVFSQQEGEREIVSRLEACCQSVEVTHRTPDKWTKHPRGFGALLFPDAMLPRDLRSLDAVLDLAQRKIVVVSLSALASLSRGAVKIKTVTQPDDPIHAQWTFADWFSPGFALADIFPWAWEARDGAFVQRQVLRTPASTRFLEKHGFTVFLQSMCAHDATSKRPVALWKNTRAGALFVLDIEPAESAFSSRSEAEPAMNVILGLLGRKHPTAGQHCTPAATETRLREIIRELPNRFKACKVVDEDVPASEVTQQIVLIGGEDHGFGLPLAPKPTIFLRSGLHSGDIESVYGSLLWVKQLVRMPPFVCPYADALGSRFRLAWIPSAASWSGHGGLLESDPPPRAPIELDIETGMVAAWIDVVAVPRQRAALIVPEMGGGYQRIAHWVPRLWSSFGADASWGWKPAPRGDLADVGKYQWRNERLPLDIEERPALFDSAELQAVRAAGGITVRLESPGRAADFCAQSILRTGWISTLIEYVVGCCVGLIALNRTEAPIVFAGFAPVSPGEALIVPRGDAALDRAAAG